MGGNIDATIVGKCGKCGGIVSTPRVWAGTNRPPETCESCGATASETRGLPTIPMNDAPDRKVGYAEFRELMLKPLPREF